MPPEDGVVTFTNPIVLLTTTHEISKAQKKKKTVSVFSPLRSSQTATTEDLTTQLNTTTTISGPYTQRWEPPFPARR